VQKGAFLHPFCTPFRQFRSVFKCTPVHDLAATLEQCSSLPK
jgi:hypothetical protein